MKTLAIADAFMKEDYYRDCFARFPEYTLEEVLFFGDTDRYAMRPICRRLEREGADAVPPPEALYDLVGEAEVLMSHLCPINARVIERAKNLKIILSNRGGLENIDLEAATARGIPVLHNPAHNANSVAELTIGLMIAEMRNLARTHALLMRGEWCEKFHNTGAVFEIAGKTVGLIGFGNIGKRVARKLAAFDCTVLVSDPFIPKDTPELEAYGCTMVDLATLLRTSDIISLHARSEDLILGAAEIAEMKPGAYFINTARPHLIDNAAITERLRSGALMGGAFDVFVTEPIPPDEPLLRLDNVTLTNHRGGATENCYMDSPAMLLRGAETYFAGGMPDFFANAKALGAK
ncbi:2-hydroxyacid dehydrogenase [Eubacteriales bacterium OttesenSCG-928-A19]|nr:2-hydroxyacid dehydrogenase [Eubacteriales bacterium OttesenSCG-928-A19]